MNILTPALAAILALPAPALAQSDPFQVDMSQFQFQKTNDEKLKENVERQNQERLKATKDVTGGVRRKAARWASRDADFARLAALEQELVIRAIGARLLEVRKHNRSLKGDSRWKKPKKISIDVKIDDSSLDEFYKDHEDSRGYKDYKSYKGKGDAVLTPEEHYWRGGKTRITDVDAQTQGPPSVDTQPKIESKGFGDDVEWHNLYKDNHWEIKTDCMGRTPPGVCGPEPCEADQLAAMVDEAVAFAGPDGDVTGLQIESSASTLRNTGQAKDLDFLELSRRRAETARDFVLRRLEQSGKPLDVEAADSLGEKLVQLTWSGKCGDGTSGPRPPDGIPGGPGCAERPADITKDNYLAYYDPAQQKTIDYYAQFKYVNVYLLVIRPSTTQTTTTIVAPGKTEEDMRIVSMRMSKGTKCRWWRVGCWWPDDISWPHRDTTDDKGGVKPCE